MPSARPAEFQRVARKLGFRRVRQTGGHQVWQHPDGRATTIPVQPGSIGPPLYYKLLRQLGIDEETFRRLK